jgi:hypothetical protein
MSKKNRLIHLHRDQTSAFDVFASNRQTNRLSSVPETNVTLVFDYVTGLLSLPISFKKGHRCDSRQGEKRDDNRAHTENVEVFARGLAIIRGADSRHWMDISISQNPEQQLGPAIRRERAFPFHTPCFALLEIIT